jgi:hypothetical protein
VNEDVQPQLSTVDEDARKRFLIEVMQELKPWHQHMVENLTRLLTLTRFASEVENKSIASPVGGAVASDILRSVVVLQHAYLEEFLREVEIALRLADGTLDSVRVDSMRKNTSFNTIKQITDMLGRVKCNIADHSEWLRSLGAMMARRHDIVHRADRVKSGDTYQLQPISAGVVEIWLDAAQQFMGSLWKPLYEKLNSPDALEKRLGNWKPSPYFTSY